MEAAKRQERTSVWVCRCVWGVSSGAWEGEGVRGYFTSMERLRKKEDTRKGHPITYVK